MGANMEWPDGGMFDPPEDWKETLREWEEQIIHPRQDKISPTLGDTLNLIRSYRKNLSRMEKIEAFLDAVVKARGWFEGHPEAALEEVEHRALSLKEEMKK